MIHFTPGTRMGCWSFGVLVVMFAFLSAPRPLAAIDWSTLFTAQDVRDRLTTEAGRQEALEFCRRLGISKVYVETYRDDYQADDATLKAARDFFRQSGLRVSGCVTPTRVGKISSGWEESVCYTHRQSQEKLAAIFRFTAGLFDEIMIDDFFFTDCECSECAAAKGAQSWRQYREKLMLQVSRDAVLGPARSANPKVKVILKFPQWYDRFQERGYIPDQEAAPYDRIWVGTELRDPSSDEWGHTQQYRGYFLYRWLAEVGGAKTGGGWFDPYGTTPALYVDQPLVTVLAGAPEVFLFHYGELNSPEYRGQVDALAARRLQYESLAQYATSFGGLSTYKPVSSEPDNNEEYIFDEIGMLGIPLLPTSHFPQNERAALFTVHSLEDVEFVPKLGRFLSGGGTGFLSQDLAHRLNGDPRLPTAGSLDLGRGEYLKSMDAGGGKLVVFSESLPRLAYVDGQNRTAQLTPEFRQALTDLRAKVADFTVTSPDAPPRVAIFPLGGRVAVANFTELPVACRLAGLAGMAHKCTKVCAIDGATLAPDGATLRLPPHSALVVE